MSESSYKIRKKMNNTIDRMNVLISRKETGGRRIIDLERKFYKSYRLKKVLITQKVIKLRRKL